MERDTNYYTAVHWLHNNYILCNNIAEIDDSIWDEMRFELGESDDIYQWFLTDASEDDVKFLEKSFHLTFTYSNKLDCFVLCVQHYGTSWRYVHATCYNDDIRDEFLGEAA